MKLCMQVRALNTLMIMEHTMVQLWDVHLDHQETVENHVGHHESVQINWYPWLKVEDFICRQRKDFGQTY